MRSEACLSDLQLESYQLGKLSEEDQKHAEEHMDLCPYCAKEVQRFDGTTDSLLAAIRTSVITGSTPDLRGTDDFHGLPDGRSHGREEPVFQSAPEDRYTFEGKLGEGGMGTVYRVRDHTLDRTVALKVIRARGVFATRERLEIEARAIARLDHPNIVKVFDFGEIRLPGESERVPFITLEFVQGESLTSWLGGNPMISVAPRLIALLARAVQHAHEHGIVHRDLKPGNVLLAPPSTIAALNTPLGCPHITDFGLVRLLADESARTPEQRMTQSGLILGTPEFMAPEQAAGNPELGPPVDVWALGVMLYQLLTGTLPFESPSPIVLLHQICYTEPMSVELVQPGISPELSAIVRACLNRDPLARPTAAELAERLEGLLNGDVTQPAEVRRDTRETAVQPLSPRRRRVGRRWGAALAVAAVAGSLIWHFWPNGPLPPKDRVKAPPSIPARLHISPLQVVHYQTDGREALARGRIGQESFATRFGDAVTLTVELSEPGYCYVIGFNFDGQEQLLWPTDTHGMPSKQVAPPRSQRVHIPSGPNRLYLDDPARSGLQVYVVAASVRPLPPYADWRAKRPLEWRRWPPGKTVWQADAAGVYAVLPGLGADRGTVREAPGAPPLFQLCRSLLEDGVETVEAIAFPVNEEKVQ